jgi:hypothetical protein
MEEIGPVLIQKLQRSKSIISKTHRDDSRHGEIAPEISALAMTNIDYDYISHFTDSRSLAKSVSFGHADK